MWAIRNRAFVLGATFVTAACGGAAAPDASQAGGGAPNGGAGGASNHVASFGGSSSPPAAGLGGLGGATLAAAAVDVAVSNSAEALAGYACSSSHVLHWGSVPSDTSTGSLWIDGQNGNAISCRVPAASAYDFDGSISGIAQFSIQGWIATSGEGNAQVAFFDSSGEMGLMLSDKNCRIQVIGNYGVEAKAIAAVFECSHLISSDDMYLWCQARGTFVFENCRQ